MHLKPEYAKLADLCAKEEHARYGTTVGVRLVYSNGELQADATDGRKLLRLRVPCPNYVGFPADTPVIIPVSDWERLCELGQPYTPGGTQVRLSLDADRNLTGASPTGRTLTLPAKHLLEGRFPDTDKVMPKDAPLFTAKVKPEHLASLLLAVAEFAGPDNDAVYVSFYGDGKPVRVVARNDGEVDGLVVQLDK